MREAAEGAGGPGAGLALSEVLGWFDHLMPHARRKEPLRERSRARAVSLWARSN